MTIILGENRYGKAENRVFRVTRHGDTHEILDLNVSVQLSGDFAATHLTGDNRNVLPTDTQRTPSLRCRICTAPWSLKRSALFLHATS